MLHAPHKPRYTPLMPRLYLEDSKLLHFRAAVTDIREFARKNGQQVWQMALDSTAFYPTGGGQPHDLGTLRAQSRSGTELTVTVEDVTEDEAGTVWHTTTKPLLTGTMVQGTVDAARRLDHMQQHTGQHLLSAVLADDFGLRTVGFHMGERDVTIDLAVEDRAAQDAVLGDLHTVETRVNRHIAGNAPVTIREVSGEQAQALLAEGALRKLPDRVGPMRLVEIAGLDLNACGGTHVQALGEVGAVLLRETERTKKALRLHFVCGLRAVHASREDRTELAAAAGALSVGKADVFAGVQRLLTEAKALSKERLRLREEIAESHAVQLAVEERIVNGLRVVHRTFADRDADYLKLLATRLLQAVPRTVVLLISCEQEPATLILAGNTPLPRGCNALLKDAIAPYALRGGGTAELAQAQVPQELIQPVTTALLKKIAER